MEILIVIFVVFSVIQSVNKQAKKQKRPQASAVPNRPVKRTAAVTKQPEKKKASAVPNRPKKQKRTKEEEALTKRTDASAKKCRFEAAYSKGRPERIGGRADYEPGTPGGMIRVRCAYCNAQNFVPAGTKEHYHCYFCWEKL